MRFYKKEIGKRVIVKWDDAVSMANSTLKDMVENGFCKKETMGKLVYHSKDFIILQNERVVGDNLGDFTLIPRGMITEVKIDD